MPRVRLYRLTVSFVIVTCFLCAYFLLPKGGLKSVKIVIRIWPPAHTVEMDDDKKSNKEVVKKLSESSRANTEDPAVIQETFLKVEKVQAQRQQLILDSCQSKGKKGLNHENMHYFIYNDEYKIIYCYIPKVACTEWKKVMMILDGYHEKNMSKIAHGEAHEGYTYKRLVELPNDEAQKRLDTYFKFMFVREPLERLLSAYRNKIAQYNLFFADRYGKDILKRYRKNPDPEHLKKGTSVTFKEFIQYLVDGYFDEHWMRQVDICMPCNIKYDVIGKFETLKEDHKYILHKAKINHLVNFPEIEQSNTASHLIKYYSDIPKQNLKELGSIYERDFAFYNYSFPGPIKSLLQDG